jgi:hypothetical protein
VEEKEYFRGVGVSFRQGKEVQVVVSDVEILQLPSAPPKGLVYSVPYVDAFVGETWWHSGAFFFSLTKKDGELFDSRHGNIPSIVSGKKGLQRC